MAKQITSSIVMVRPIAFCFNTQTAANDFFQDDLGEKKDIVEAKALIEFDGFVDNLRGKGRIADGPGAAAQVAAAVTGAW